MKVLAIVISTILLAMPPFVKAQASRGEVLLEAYETSAGMVTHPGKILFIRVSKSGGVEFQQTQVKDGIRRLITNRYKLDRNGLVNLERFLGSIQIESLDSEFGPDTPTLDHVIILDINLGILPQPKLVKLTNFSPNLSKVSDKYPPSLIELVCRINSLRGRTGFRMLGNDCLPMK